MTGTLAAVFSIACSKPSPPASQPTEATAATAGTKPSAATQPSAVPVTFGPRGPLSIVPKIPPRVMGMMDHATVSGWSSDASGAAGSVFAFCRTSGATAIDECTFVRPSGEREVVDDEAARKGEADPSKKKALDARVKAMGLASDPRATWDFASDIEVVWEVAAGNQDVKPPVPGVLKVGARVRGESTVFKLSLSERSTGYHDRIHVEAMALSPDGAYLGVLAHAFAGEFSDAFPLAIVATRDLALGAYTVAAAAHEQAGDRAKAAELRSKAAALAR